MEVKDFRANLGRALQRELIDKRFIVHADQAVLESEFGRKVDSHILSDENGKALFNEISEAHDIPPLKDPAGYMALDDNLSSYLLESYEHTYTEALYDIQDDIKGGTGHAVKKVLSSIQSNVRTDIKPYVPEDMNYGDLRFVRMTAELEPIVDQFVNIRLSKTLTYEKSRNFEQATKDRTRERHHLVGLQIKDALAGEEQESLEI